MVLTSKVVNSKMLSKIEDIVLVYSICHLNKAKVFLLRNILLCLKRFIK